MESVAPARMMFKFIKNHLWFNIISTAILVVGVLALILWISLRGPNSSRDFARAVDQDLVEAAALGDKAAIDAAIAAGADVNAVDDGGNSALYIAYREHRNKDGYEYLLKMGADPNLLNDWGRSIVHYAARERDDSDWLRLALEHGGDANIREGANHGQVATDATPIFAAVFSRRVENLTLLLEHGANLDARRAARQHTPMIYAAELRQPLVVRWLMEHGADWTARTSDGISVAEAEIQHRFDATSDPESASSHEWILDFLEKKGVDLAEAEERSREIYGPNFRRFSSDND